MKPIYTANELKELDNFAVKTLNIPAIVLMESAAANCTNEIVKYFKEKKLNLYNIAIFCGTGNNGGDGMAIARHLNSLGFRVDVYVIGDIKKMSQETKKNLKIIQNDFYDDNKLFTFFIEEKDFNSEDFISSIEYRYECIIDAIFGIGFRGNIENDFIKNIIEILNAYKALKIAIDVPSGYNLENMESVIRADLTITIGAVKLDFVLDTYKKMLGEVRLVSLYDGQRQLKNCNNILLEREDIADIIPHRKKDSNKYDYGCVLIIGGSKYMPGAAALVSNAAIKMGAGSVKLVTPKLHYSIFPEIMINEAETDKGIFDTKHYSKLHKYLRKFDTIVIGPGMTKDNNTLKLIRDLVLKSPNHNWIIDADGIDAFSINDKLNDNIILTPHLNEFKRLCGNEQLNANNKFELYNTLKDTALRMNCIILLKGSLTMISDGIKTYFNPFGNAGMATAGSGDVLTGIIAANISKKDNFFYTNPLSICSLSSLIHSSAGDCYAEKNNMESLIASDIINNIEKVVNAQIDRI